MPKPTLARELRLETLDDLLAEAKRIAAQPEADSRGTWTPAQNVWHVGRLIKAGVEGNPAKVPLLLRLIGPLFKKRVTTVGFSPGIKLPDKTAQHMVAPRDTTMQQAMDMIEPAIAKAKAQGFLPANPLFGKMSPAQWVALHCRHAEMHFGLIDLKD